MREDERMTSWLSSIGGDDRVAVCTIVRGEVLFGVERLAQGRRVDNPAPIDTDEALKLIFGEGELTIASASPDAGFHAALSFGGDAVMDLVGSVIAGDNARPLVATAKGRGRPNSSNRRLRL
jgi:hypothetical protein